MLAQFGQLLRAIANGPDPARIPAPTEVIAMMELGNPPADWLWPQGIYTYSGYAVEGALAGNKSMVALSNPAGSGVIATVEAVDVLSTDTPYVYLRQAVADNLSAFDSDGTEYTRDVRTYRSLVSPQPSRHPSLNVLSDQAAQQGQAAVLLFADYDDGTWYHYASRRPFVLLPGTGLVAVPGNDEKACYATFYWRERLYDPKEVVGSAFV